MLLKLVALSGYWDSAVACDLETLLCIANASKNPGSVVELKHPLCAEVLYCSYAAQQNRFNSVSKDDSFLQLFAPESACLSAEAGSLVQLTTSQVRKFGLCTIRSDLLTYCNLWLSLFTEYIEYLSG